MTTLLDYQGHLAERFGSHRPHVIVGDTRSHKLIRLLELHGWARMVIKTRFNTYPGERWGFDNGAYVWWQRGEEFQTDVFLRRLDQARKRMEGTPYMAVTPDIPAEGDRSLEFSLRWRECLPNDWPWYLVVQDGMREQDVVREIGKFSGLFLGGSDAFKREAAKWCRIAHRFGKPFHYGRCGTLRKLHIAKEIKADSIDSAFPLWTSERFQAFFLHWMYGDPQLRLEFN